MKKPLALFAVLLIGLGLFGPDSLPVINDVTPGPISVLVLYESEDLSDPRNAWFVDMLNDTSTRDYLNQHCRKENGRPAYRFVDSDADVSMASPWWQAAIAEAKQHVDETGEPALAISNGRQGVMQPMKPDYMKTLRKWGGD